MTLSIDQVDVLPGQHILRLLFVPEKIQCLHFFLHCAAAEHNVFQIQDHNEQQLTEQQRHHDELSFICPMEGPVPDDHFHDYE